MLVRLNFPPGTEVSPVFADDKKTIIGVDITPLFPGRRATAVVGHGESTNRHGDKLDQFILTVSGVKGNLFFRRRNEGVVPLVDLTDDERARLGGQDDEPEDDEEEEADAQSASAPRRT